MTSFSCPVLRHLISSTSLVSAWPLSLNRKHSNIEERSNIKKEPPWNFEREECLPPAESLSAGAGGEVSGLTQTVETFSETKRLNPRAGKSQGSGGERGGRYE